MSICNEAPPQISKVLLRLFLGYSERHLRRHFHSVRLLGKGTPRPCDSLPLVIYFNHSSWWDPLLCLVLARWFFPRRSSYGPIEANALRRYGFLRRLGLFGLETGTARGAVSFLRTASSILADQSRALWLTPQGKFVDSRARPPVFQRGLGHLAARLDHPAAFVPLAIEYTFWEERLPELLISFGEPIVFRGNQILTADESTKLFESALASVQDQLSAASQRRCPDEWRTLLHGRAGASGVYDFWRRLGARLRGQKFNSAHSDL